MLFVQTHGGGVGAEERWEKRILGKENSNCKGPKSRVLLVLSMISKWS